MNNISLPLKCSTILTMMMLIFGPVACQPTAKVTDEAVTIIDDVQLAELIEAEPGLVIVDVRPELRYRTGHIPGAINIPLPDLRYTDPRFEKAKHVVVYGDGPRNTLSHAAAKKLLAGGQVVVSDFRGGIDAWRKAGRKLAH